MGNLSARDYERTLDLASTVMATPASASESRPLEPVAETPLTPREIAVLRLVADGMTADAIGHRLGISTRTVHKHTENLYRKLSVADRLTAVMRAQSLGLLPTPPAR